MSLAGAREASVGGDVSSVATAGPAETEPPAEGDRPFPGAHNLVTRLGLLPSDPGRGKSLQVWRVRRFQGRPPASRGLLVASTPALHSRRCPVRPPASQLRVVWALRRWRPRTQPARTTANAGSAHSTIGMSSFWRVAIGAPRRQAGARGSPAAKGWSQQDCDGAVLVLSLIELRLRRRAACARPARPNPWARPSIGMGAGLQ